MFPALAVPVTASDRETCVATDVLRRVGEKWSVLVLALLRERPYGFNELDRTIQSLSRRILTRTLRTLEADGLVARSVTPERVLYSLTDLGRSLLPLILALGEWAVSHADEIAAARLRAAA